MNAKHGAQKEFLTEQNLEVLQEKKQLVDQAVAAKKAAWEEILSNMTPEQRNAFKGKRKRKVLRKVRKVAVGTSLLAFGLHACAHRLMARSCETEATPPG